MDQGTTEAPHHVIGDADGIEWPPTRSRPRLPIWPIVLGILLLVLGFTLNWLLNLEVDYYALSPGPVNDVGDFVSVVDQDPVEDSGELFFLTVSISPEPFTALEYIGAYLDREVALVKRETIRPTGVSQEELTRQNLALMEASKRDAIFVALTRLGYEVELKGSGALVLSTIEGTAADGVIRADDVIVQVDGTEIEFADDAVDALSGRPPGTEVELVIERVGEDGTSETLTIGIVLGPFMGVDENEEPVVDENRGMVGVFLDDFDPVEVYPVDVQIDSQNIGGPSAGLMFTLELINQLTDEDITKGRRIAGTGTIARDGTVGSIGGVQQKVYGAIHAGADHVLVPAANYEDALAAAGDDIEVVRVETIDDALAFLESL